MDADTKAAFTKLTNILERGFASVADDIADLRTKLKGDIAGLGERLVSIQAELRSINQRLDLLEEQVGGIRGFSKEIDDLRGRIAAIEKHLGITKKIAA